MMNEIKIKKYYREPSEKYNLISVCIFRLEENYKSIAQYYYGLKELIKLTPKYFPEFYLRIYFDNSVVKTTHSNKIINDEVLTKWIPLLKDASKLKHVQLTKYQYKYFTTPNKLYHEGLFGTLVRFIPFFDYKSNKNLENVIVADIELNESIIAHTRKVYDLFNKSKSQFHYRTNVCYDLGYRFSADDIGTSIWQKIIAGLIISKIKFPKYLLNDFINCIKMKQNCPYLDKFLQLKNPRSMQPEHLRLYDKTVLVYGIDELFMDNILLKYILDHKIPFSYYFFEMMGRPIYQHYLQNNKYKNPAPELIELYQKFMGKYYNKNKSLEDNYRYFDKIIYKVSERSDKNRKEIYEYFYNNFYNMMKEIDKNNEAEKYGFTKKSVTCSLRYNDPYGSDFEMYQ